MANRDHLAKLKQGVEAWNQWRVEHPDIQPDLERADLKGTNLEGANLEETKLLGANLTAANLAGANLKRADLRGANLAGATFTEANLQEAYLQKANFKWAKLFGAKLEDANIAEADFEEAYLGWANLRGAYLGRANLERVTFTEANLTGANLTGANLKRADLREASFDAETRLSKVVLSDGRSRCAWVADLNWGGANLAVVDWTTVKVLGDEEATQQQKETDGKMTTKLKRMEDYRSAVRANRQLSMALRDQGLNEESDYFAYRAQRLQRIVLRYQGKFGRYLFSGFLDLLAGYGYRPGRSVVAYLLIIFGFMGLYLLNAHFVTPHLRWDEALVLSVSCFHGRGFFSQAISLGDTYARLAAAEAVVGLIIEISFIATFTQRFFGK